MRSSRSTSPFGRSIRIRAGTTRRVVDDGELARELLRQLREPAMPDGAGRTVVDEEPGGVASLGRMLGDQLRGQVVVELGGVHPTASVASCPWTRGHSNGPRRGSRKPRPDGPLRRIWRPRSSARASRSRRSPRPRRSSKARCPSRSARPCTRACAPRCCRSGAPWPRSAACSTRSIRRLERLEGDVLAERHARIDDLALLVDLVSSGWRGVSERLERVEHAVAPVAAAPRSGLERSGSAGRAGSGSPCPPRSAARSGRRARPRARSRSAARARCRARRSTRTAGRSARARRP